MDLARDLEALATGRRTTDLRPDDGDGGSERDLNSVDGTTTTLLLDHNNLKEFLFSQLQLRALHTLSLSSNRLRCLDTGIAAFTASLTVLKLECNALRRLPDALCELSQLEALWLGCNELEELPADSAGSAGYASSASTPASCVRCHPRSATSKGSRRSQPTTTCCASSLRR